MMHASDTTGSLYLESGSVRIEISGGELVGLEIDGREWMHRASEPGWGHSDTEMFPIIGPTAQTGYRVQVPRGNAIQDQHGLLRELEYTLVSRSEAEIVLEKTYKAGELVVNSKHPERSTVKWLIWPFDFRFTKKVRLLPDGVEVRFGLQGERDMPYMLGYHPAFSLRSPQARILTRDREIGIKEVMEVGDRALEVASCTALLLEDTEQLRLESEGFGHFMLWSPDPEMLCVEPITYYPYNAAPGKLHEGFRHLQDKPLSFSLTMRRNEQGIGL